MKEYIKSQIKNIPMTLVMFILFYGITTLATNYLFNSNEVSYDNTISGIKQDNVQGAIDELYACTSNYAAYNTRLTNAESTIGTGSLTTTSSTIIGGINELKTNIGTVPSGKTTQGQINDLNDATQFSFQRISTGTHPNITINENLVSTVYGTLVRFGSLRILNLSLILKSATLKSSTAILTLSSSDYPKSTTHAVGYLSNSGAADADGCLDMIIYSNGQIVQNQFSSKNMASGTLLNMTIVWPTT